MKNPYLPQKATIEAIFQETDSDLDIKTFQIKFCDQTPFEFRPGQFVEVSIPGVGEAPFGFASSPLEKGFIELTIKKVGLVTEAVHRLKAGAVVWIRGPFGNTFPVHEFAGNPILIVAGGLGLAPLRPLVLEMLNEQNRSKYSGIQMLLAARSSGDFIYRRDYESWAAAPDTTIVQTIDNPEEGWVGKVGFPHNLLGEMRITPGTIAVTCGPPIMIKFVVGKLGEIGIPKEKIFTTLEMRMTCGIGKCGKCNIGHQYVCIDGPVFNMAQLAEMPNEY
ncbi:MAG TPA: FAD/NAD(P)-binding protein [Bacillota bacterium]|nr:FAD/NAD(P)-binding protein [Bacillota bacterium]